MEVFLDIVLLENFVVNYFLLYITSQMVRTKIKVKNHILAALFGSLYVVTLFIPELKLLITLPFKLLITVLIVAIAFRKKNILFLLKTTVIFFVSSFILAGVCVYLQWNGINGVSIFNNSISFSYKQIFLALMIIYLVINRALTYVKDRIYIDKLIYDVKIVTKNLELPIKAFLDTGNELREPATNLPVMVVDKKILVNMDLQQYEKFYISYKVVNGDIGKMEGFKPEYVELSINGKLKKREVIIAYNDRTLSSNDEYNALLSRGII